MKNEMKLVLDMLQGTFDGGPGSGNFGHAGRPGEVGGSAPGEGGGSKKAGKTEPKKTEKVQPYYTAEAGWKTLIVKKQNADGTLDLHYENDESQMEWDKTVSREEFDKILDFHGFKPVTNKKKFERERAAEEEELRERNERYLRNLRALVKGR